MSGIAGQLASAGAVSGPELVLINGIQAGGPSVGTAGGTGLRPPATHAPSDTLRSASIPGSSGGAGRDSNLEAFGAVSVLDRGLHFGDGLFETIACRGGRARFLSLHLERLAAGCQRLQIELVGPQLLRQEIEAAIAGTQAALIKLIVTRGDAVARGYGRSGRECATRVLLRYAWPAEDATAWREGVSVRQARMRLGENPALAGMKHLNRLEQVLARSERPTAEAPELLLFSSSGLLVSGTMSNVFIVQNGQLRTPRVETCGVAGVMRRVVLREAAQAGIPAEEGALSPGDLDQATEAFLTNARIGLWPIRSIEERALSPGDTTRKLQALIGPMLENPVDA